MLRRLLPVAIALTALVAALPTTVQAAALFYETTVVTDTATDYASNGALDVVAVHLTEKFRYSPETGLGEEILVVRFEPRALSELTCPGELRYVLHFTVGGADKTLYGGASRTPSTEAGCVIVAVDGNGKTTIPGTQDSLLVTATKASQAVVDGTAVSSIWASSHTIAGGQVVDHDVAPFPNNNAPQNAAPTDGLQTYTTVGTFPFVTVEPTAPVNQFSVGGAEVEYEFNFYSHQQVKDDQIRIRFHKPSGWSVSPSQGTTGPAAEGSVTGANDGAPRPFSFALSANGITEDGDVTTVIMEVITESGGHVNVTTLTTISGAKIVDPNITFQLDTPGPFTAGEDNEVRATLIDATGNLSGIRVAFDVIKTGQPTRTFDATATGNGTYKAIVRFQGEGTYTLDAYVSSLTPSPHQEFLVQVKDSGFAPAPGPALLLLALALFVAWRRRAL